jgi:glycerol-3-phosphate acyltransferase PlsY
MKGVVAVKVAQILANNEVMLLCGLLAVVGHIFPIWLKFKGGKGVATAIGVFIAFNPLLGGACIALWLLCFFSTRISGIAAVGAFLLLPVVTYYFFNQQLLFVIVVVICLLVLMRHYDNVVKIIKR